VIAALKPLLSGSLLREFKQRSQQSMRLMLVNTRAQLFDLLQQQVKPPPSWNPLRFLFTNDPSVSLCLLGSDWLDRAIAADLIQPFDQRSLGSHWATLPSLWQQAVTRKGPEGEQIWGVPWRWGMTAIAYNRRLVKDPLTDWADLWRPDLRGKITLPDHPREVIGLTLKKMGLSSHAPLQVSDPLRSELKTLDRQVKMYTSSSYLQMLRIEDSWVAVGWTEDLFKTQRNYPEIEIVIPRSGTTAWWDLWVIPRRPLQGSTAATSSDPFLSQWVDFILDPALTARMVNATEIASVQPIDRQQLADSLQHRVDLDPAVLQKVDLWQPLSPEQASLYLDLWRQLRLGKL
jgi:putative spermidine/putrescine transport system substrate-binding protein